ncbi:MAG TPA: CRTAC1 family protein [Tepidisphaeraceae bacterium]|nr:CRTAC1 family protein [Tepidisphaeraceae bacterium]
MQRPQVKPKIEDDEEDVEERDDKIIGRALRWSLLVLLILGGGVVAGIYWFNHRPVAQLPRAKPLVMPSLRDRALVELPSIPFTNITESAGIKFVHVNGAEGEKLLPETMGGGCAFFDFDNDGNQDLLLINSSSWPWAKTPNSAAKMALYHNDGKGLFIDVTAGSGLDVSFYGMGVATGDFDNDGNVDVFITAVGGNHLFRNLGNGKFADVTPKSAVGGSNTGWSSGAAFLDYDNDGKLDLFVCNYVAWSRENDIAQDFKLLGVGRAYGPPLAFAGTFPCLYHNNGDGTFTDVSAAAGMQVKNPATGNAMGKSLAAIPVDLDRDGLIDIIVANDTVQNFVFHNKGGGNFEEIGAMSGMAFDTAGQARGAMGIDAVHFRNNRTLGVAVGNFANEMNALYVGESGTLNFRDDAIATGVGPVSRQLLTFGLFFFDADLDGRLDLLTVNGHIEDQINKVQSSQSYRQPAQLLWNAGAGFGADFIPLTSKECGPDLFTPIVGRGAAYADMDNDGDLDIIMAQNGAAPILLRNDRKLGNHYIRFKLVGSVSNRDAIGAWMEGEVNGQTIRRQVMPTRSYFSQVELPVTIGLGRSSMPGIWSIIWPDGAHQEIRDVKLDALTTVVQPKK